MSADELVAVGKVVGLYGVRGWVKVHSETDPPANLLAYRPWHLSDARGPRPVVEVAEGQLHGKGLIVRLDGYDDRDRAATLVGCEIRVARGEFAALDDGEYYWADLVGLAVVTVDGIELGRVERLLATGANDVLVVRGQRERLIPYTPGDAVVGVDLDRRRITVAWDPDF